MSIFGSIESRIEETCSCGAEFRYRGPLASLAASDWRQMHRCRRPTATPSTTDTTTNEGHGHD